MSVAGTIKDREYPRIVVGDFGCSMNRSKMTLDHADPQAFCLGTCAQDVDQIFELVVDLSRLSNTRDWPYSEELLSMASRCGEVRDLSLELLELLKACSEEKQKLEAAGKLEFVPLLE